MLIYGAIQKRVSGNLLNDNLQLSCIVTSISTYLVIETNGEDYVCTYIPNTPQIKNLNKNGLTCFVSMMTASIYPLSSSPSPETSVRTTLRVRGTIPGSQGSRGPTSSTNLRYLRPAIHIFHHRIHSVFHKRALHFSIDF